MYLQLNDLFVIYDLTLMEISNFAIFNIKCL